MTKLLLVLILLADPSLKDTGEALAARLAEQGAGRVQVVAGPEAAAQLRQRGLQDADLMAGPGLGAQLTVREPGLAIVRLERLDRGEDRVIEARLWLDGRQESTVSITGPRDGRPGDPGDGTQRAVLGVIGRWLAHEPAGSATAAPAGPPVSRLAEQGRWAAITAAVARLPEPGPRELYYLVLAERRQGHREEAEAALARLRAAHPGHVMLAAAEALTPAPVPAAVAPINDQPEADDGGNVLR